VFVWLQVTNSVYNDIVSVNINWMLKLLRFYKIVKIPYKTVYWICNCCGL